MVILTASETCGKGMLGTTHDTPSCVASITLACLEPTLSPTTSPGES